MAVNVCMTLLFPGLVVKEREDTANLQGAVVLEMRRSGGGVVVRVLKSVKSPRVAKPCLFARKRFIPHSAQLHM